MPERRARVVLAFDFGLRRIGIACGDTASGMAAPRATLHVNAAGIDWTAIDHELSALRPDLLLVGRPCNADGSPGTLAAAADGFAATLARRAQLPVERIDEHGSSIEGYEILRQQRARGRRRVTHGDIDGAAAAIILERWLHSAGTH